MLRHKLAALNAADCAALATTYIRGSEHPRVFSSAMTLLLAAFDRLLRLGFLGGFQRQHSWPQVVVPDEDPVLQFTEPLRLQLVFVEISPIMSKARVGWQVDRVVGDGGHFHHDPKACRVRRIVLAAVVPDTWVGLAVDHHTMRKAVVVVVHQGHFLVAPPDLQFFFIGNIVNLSLDAAFPCWLVLAFRFTLATWLLTVTG